MKIPYGFTQDFAGTLEVIPEQAALIQEIYWQYLSGKSLGGVTDFLFGLKIPSPSGKDRWGHSVLDGLLSNSKYIGGIISFDDYYAVQAEKGRRSNLDESTNQRKATQYYSKDVLSGFLFAQNAAPFIGASPSTTARRFGDALTRSSTASVSGNTHPPSQRQNSRRRSVKSLERTMLMKPWCVRD